MPMNAKRPFKDSPKTVPISFLENSRIPEYHSSPKTTAIRIVNVIDSSLLVHAVDSQGQVP